MKKTNNNLIGVCALMGNIQAECSFRANDVESAKSKAQGWSDESYTEAVDNGTYSADEFFHDKYGYGLCQLTWWERKKKLYDFCKSRNKSIGDLETQIDFICEEIKKYTTPYKALFTKDWGDLDKCTRTIMLKYEAPANQTETNQKKRVGYAQQIYNEYSKKNNISDTKTVKNVTTNVTTNDAETVYLTKAVKRYATALNSLQGINSY